MPGVQSGITGSSPANRSTSLRIERICDPKERARARDFVNEYHSYIKWADRPSRKLYWTLYEGERLVGVFGLASAFSRPKAVADFMREHGMEFNQVGNNIVYCLAGHHIKNAGTRFLKLLRNDAKQWWHERYGDDLKALQTFILPPRTGAMYKADNWQQLGHTTGGRALATRTLYGEEREKHPEAEVRTFKSGEVKYLLREWVTTEPKLIFMRIL
ncbi:hypothetical protein LCGC14_2082020 [marine sediment metagenome]|uniref:Uncharacterized protein n=1 Tax=marine sediment metagenome TaxID=412755 RepID=A0A0F9GTL4_9ZZZZ